MPLEPSIALNRDAPDFAKTINEFAQARTSRINNAMNQAKLDEYDRARQEEEAVRNYFLKNPNADASDPSVHNDLVKFGKTGLAYSKSIRETNQSASTLANTDLDAAKKALELSRESLSQIDPTSPDALGSVLAIHELNHQNPALKGIVTPERYEAGKQEIIDAYRNGTLGDYQKRMIQGADTIRKQMEPLIQNQSLPDGSNRFVSIDKSKNNMTVIPDSQTPSKVQIRRTAGNGVEQIYYDNNGKLIAAPIPGATPAIAPVQRVQPLDPYQKGLAVEQSKDDTALRRGVEAGDNNRRLADELEAALNSGKAITGAAADWRLKGLKILKEFGADDGGRIKTTEDINKKIAQLTLQGIPTSGLGTGKGFTDQDRLFLQDAISGKLPNDESTFRQLVATVRKAENFKANRWNDRMDQFDRMGENSPALKYGWQRATVIPLDEQGNVVNTPSILTGGGSFNPSKLPSMTNLPPLSNRPPLVPALGGQNAATPATKIPTRQGANTPSNQPIKVNLTPNSGSINYFKNEYAKNPTRAVAEFEAIYGKGSSNRYR